MIWYCKLKLPKLSAPKLPIGKSKRKSKIDSEAELSPEKQVQFKYDSTFKVFDEAKKIAPKREKPKINPEELKMREKLSSQLTENANIENLTKQRGSLGLEIPESAVVKESAEELAKTISIAKSSTYVEDLAISEEIDRIERLIYDVRKDSSNVTPFINFAIESSGSDSSITFMESLYYYTQSSGDSQVIVELAKMSGVELFAAVDEIVSRKMKKIDNLPLLLVASVIIPLFGILAAFGVSIFSEVFSNM